MAGYIDGPLIMAFLQSHGIDVPTDCAMPTKTEQVYDVFPSLAPLYFDFEKNWDSTCLPEFYTMYWPTVPLTICATYVAVIFGGDYFMKSAGIKPFNLKWPLAMWNLLLSVFSLAGMSRMVPHVLVRLASHGYYDTVCEPAAFTYGHEASGLWIFLFIFSKIPELVDTIFIVLRQKPLILLHWYHHISVLSYCWQAFGSQAANGQYFGAMNFTVHGVMYGYYFLMAVKMKPKALRPEYITILQLVQMVGGIVVVSSSTYFKATGSACDVSNENLTAAGLMYLSYFILFFLFALNRYGGAAVTVLAIPAVAGVIAHLALNVLSPMMAALLLAAPTYFASIFAVRWWDLKHVAGPAALPVVGTPYNTADELESVAYLESMQAKYGDVWVFWSGVSPTVVVTSPKCTKDILSDTKTFKEGADLSERDGMFAREVAKACVLDLGELDKRGKKLTVKLPAGAAVVMPTFFTNCAVSK